MFKNILVCCDGSKHGACAAEFALRLAGEQHADVELLSIVEPLPDYLATPKEIQEEEEFDHECLTNKQVNFLRMAEQMGLHAEAKVLTGKAADMIIHVAKEDHTDLIVMGQHTGHAIWVHQAGHTAAAVLEKAPCSVLIVNV